MNTKITLKKIIGHLRTIHLHRKWVRYFCFKFGLYKQGLLHDLSKYSPTEFWESIHYYSGTDSPINAAKKDKGYSDAWLHHRGRNMHHYVAWIDNFDKGGTPIPMPYKYMMELVADYLGAGAAYSKIKSKKDIDEIFYRNEYKWWERNKEGQVINPVTKDWIEYYLKNFCMNSTFLQEERWQAYRKTGRVADEIIYENRCTEEFHKLKEILNA